MHHGIRLSLGNQRSRCSAHPSGTVSVPSSQGWGMMLLLCLRAKTGCFVLVQPLIRGTQCMNAGIRLQRRGREMDESGGSPADA